MQAGPGQKKASHLAFETADRVHSAAIHMLRVLRRRDRESGIGPAQLSALSVLVFAGPRSLAELAQAEEVKAPTMSRIVGGLRRAELVHMATNKIDRRAVVITATERGVRLMQKARAQRVESLARAVSDLDHHDIVLVKKASEIIERLSRSVASSS